MSVRREQRRDRISGAVRSYWIVDINFEHPDGRRERVRKVPPVQTKRGAEHYEREIRALLLAGTYGKKEETKEAPTLEAFKERFIDDWCRANKHKPSGIDSKESCLRNHLLPLFGRRRLDSFTPADEDLLKKRFVNHSSATYNNHASTLNSVLRAAKRWQVVQQVPHHFALLKRQKARPKFYDFDQFQWLVEAAGKVDPRIQLVAYWAARQAFVEARSSRSSGLMWICGAACSRWNARNGRAR